MDNTVYQPSDGLLRQIEKASGQPLSRCYQCKKCSAGCPVEGVADLHTNEVVRLIQLGDMERLLNSSRLWLCVGCKTCQARCPNGIDVSSALDVIKDKSFKQGSRQADTRIPAFYKSFMDVVGMSGRLYELGMIGLYKMRTKTYMDDMELGIDMLKKGKLKLMPDRVKNMNQIKAIFRKGRDKK
jgi:heterodisulfide reductase subunit C